MYYLTKEREEKNYAKQYWNHRDVNFIEFLESSQRNNDDFKKIKDLVLSFDNEDLIKDMPSFKRVFDLQRINGAALYFLNMIKNPKDLINTFTNDLSLNIQEIYKPHDNAALFSVNGTYYSIEAVDGYTQFRKLAGVDTFNGLEFNFDNSGNTRDLLLMMFDENLSYSQPEKMSKHEALSYVIDLVDTNKYYLYNNEIPEFLNTFDVNSSKYIKRDFLNFSKEANEYISSVISQLPTHNHGQTFDIIKRECDVKSSIKNYDITRDTPPDTLERMKEKHSKFAGQIDFNQFSCRELLRKNGIPNNEITDVDVKKIRKEAGTQKMQDTKRKKNTFDF
ncbi:hypothetical protein [Pseudomonas extremaustralis]